MNAYLNQQNDDGETALIIAAKNGHTEVVKTLGNYGADINIKDNRGFTALMYATAYGHIDTALALYDLQKNDSEEANPDDMPC